MISGPLIVYAAGRVLHDPDVESELLASIGPEATGLLKHLVSMARPNAHRQLQVRTSDEDLVDSIAVAWSGRGWGVRKLNQILGVLTQAGLVQRPQPRGLLVLHPALHEPVENLDLGRVVQFPEGAERTQKVLKTHLDPAERTQKVLKTHLRALMNEDEDDHSHEVMRGSGTVASAVRDFAIRLGVEGKALQGIPDEPDRALACLLVARAEANDVGRYFNKIFARKGIWPGNYESHLRAVFIDDQLALVDRDGSRAPDPKVKSERPSPEPAAPSTPWHGKFCGQAAESGLSLEASRCAHCKKGLHTWVDAGVEATA
jgi:hypothetical protein